ncbi:hypothetical protein [Streptomyces clavifer]|uniref:hypothetical protein n=1 Tax=Streptomyces clavifer TaxID=68188 RepID=UPI003816D323
MVISTRFDAPRAFVVALWGRTDLDKHGRLEAVFGEAQASGDPVVVDLAGLALCEAPLLGHLLAVRLKTRLILVGPLSMHVQRRLDVTNTATVFEILPDLTSALARLSL